MLKNENIVCFSNFYWGPLKQRYEHIMLELSRHNRVLFFELDSDIIRQAKRNLLFKWLRGPVKVLDNFFVASPPPSFPFKYTIPMLNTISQRLNVVYYKKIIRKMGFKDFILWMTRPAHFELIGRMGEKLSVYDCVDAHKGFHLIHQQQLMNLQVRNLIKMEEKLLKRANLVLTSSQELYTEKKNFNKNTYFVPNACDAGHFKKALDPATKIAARMAEIKKPVIGFIGLVDRCRLDVDLIKKVAAAYKDYSIALIGPNYLYNEGFSGYDNVHMLGEINYEEIPNYLKAIDVAIMPYKRNELVKSINPVKLYEYLAAGKPVVCMDYAETRGLEHLIKVARNEDEFIDLISACMQENSPELINRRLESVKGNTWDKRVEVISEVLEKHL